MVIDTTWQQDGFEKLCDVVLSDGLPVIDYAGRSQDNCLTYVFLADGHPVHAGQSHGQYGLVSTLCGLTSPIATGEKACVRDALIEHLRSGASIELRVRRGHTRKLLGERNCDCAAYEDAIQRRYLRAADLHQLAA